MIKYNMLSNFLYEKRQAIRFLVIGVVNTIFGFSIYSICIYSGMSILVATLYLELQKLAETVFFAVPDGGSSVMAGAIATTPAPSSSSPFP